MDFLITIVLQVLVLLIIVPAATGGGVAIRKGGFFRGLLALLVSGLLNLSLWFAITLLTIGMALVAQVITFGLVGLLINALAIKLTGALMEDAFHVRSYGSAFVAAIVLVVSHVLITRILL